MGRTMLWVTRGPQAGQFIEVNHEEAAQAEADGWGQQTEGRDHTAMQAAQVGRHDKAEAFLSNRMGGYDNRELRAAPAPAPKPAEPVSEDPSDAKPKKAPAPPTKKK